MSDHQLHFFFFPLMAQGHMIPTIDMAKLFSSRGLKTTLVTTHQHVPMFNKSIAESRRLGFQISVRAIRFPAAEVGLPEGWESLDHVTTEESMNKFTAAVAMLQGQLEELLQDCRPDVLVSDSFLPWTFAASEKFGIPRLYFHGSSSFIVSVSANLKRYKPYQNVKSDSDPFLLPEFPHRIQLTRSQIHDSLMQEEPETEFDKMVQQISDSNAKSFGAIVNSFYELEPDYFNYNRDKFGIRAWNIGPLFLQIDGAPEDQSRRGNESSIDQEKCLNWLDSKKPNSVIYVCFGSLAGFTLSQLHEIALGLEKSGQNFIWVVKSCVDEQERSKWLPNGFEERTEEKGIIIKGWAPQILILGHESVGAFVTHCGWNSTLEAICAGKPMVTCPLFADQFFNEKLLTEVLRIGVGVGSRKNSWVSSDAVKADSLAMAVDRVMVGEEAVEMRKRAEALKEMAKKAVENGGSSYLGFCSLIEDLRAYNSATKEE